MTHYVPDLKKTEEGLGKLNVSIRELNRTTKTSSLVMGIFTAVLVIIAIYQFVQLFTLQIPFTKLQAQLQIQGVINACKINSDAIWIDPNGKVHSCSEMPKAWFQNNEK